jgi:hypothetical protein
MQFVAAVYAVTTLVDGGIRASLDLLESAIPEAAQLMDYKRRGVALRVTIEPLDEGLQDDPETGEG